jgi:hypothetical protein
MPMAVDCRSSRCLYVGGEAVAGEGETVGCYTGEVVGRK